MTAARMARSRTSPRITKCTIPYRTLLGNVVLLAAEERNRRPFGTWVLENGAVADDLVLSLGEARRLAVRSQHLAGPPPAAGIQGMRQGPRWRRGRPGGDGGVPPVRAGPTAGRRAAARRGHRGSFRGELGLDRLDQRPERGSDARHPVEARRHHGRGPRRAAPPVAAGRLSGGCGP